MRTLWALRQTMLTAVLTLALALAAGLPQFTWERPAALPRGGTGVASGGSGAARAPAVAPAAQGVFILALDQRDFSRSAVFWWAGWEAAPVQLLEAGANPQLAIDRVAGRLYLADTSGSGIAARSRLRVYDLSGAAAGRPTAVQPSAGQPTAGRPTTGQPTAGRPPKLQLRQEVTVADRARYKEPAWAPFLGVREGGGPVYLVGSTGVSNLDYTSWVDGYDPKSLQANYQGRRYPQLVAPRLLVPAVEGDIRAVLWAGTRFLALGAEGAVVREWTAPGPAGAAGSAGSTGSAGSAGSASGPAGKLAAAALAADGKRVYAFRARGFEWFAWDKSWGARGDLRLPDGWQTSFGAAALSPDGDRVYLGVGPRELAARGTFREVWVLDAATGDTLERVRLTEPADGLAPARDGLSLALWDQHAETVSLLTIADWSSLRQGTLEGWTPAWVSP